MKKNLRRNEKKPFGMVLKPTVTLRALVDSAGKAQTNKFFKPIQKKY